MSMIEHIVYRFKVIGRPCLRQATQASALILFASQPLPSLSRCMIGGQHPSAMIGNPFFFSTSSRWLVLWSVVYFVVIVM